MAVEWFAALQNPFQLFYFNWFAHVIIHAAGQIYFPVACQGVGSDGYNARLLIGRPLLTNLPGSLEAVH